MIYTSKPWQKFYPKGTPAEIDIPEISVVDGFNGMVDQFPNRPAMHFLGITLSYLISLTTDFGGKKGRYILRRNPVRMQEIRRIRHNKLKNWKKKQNEKICI